MNFPYKLVDLTHTLDNSIPTWGGGCGFDHNLHVDYIDCEGEDKFRMMKLSIDAGIGTHVDAPSHCIKDGKNIDDFDVNELCMPCVIIDVSHKVHERYSVTVGDIIGFEGKHGLIPKSSCVMIKTGWSKFWKEPKKYRNDLIFPSISPEAGNLLLKREINALGIDTLSADRSEDGFKVHRAFLGSGKILIENVANLNNMPPIGSYLMILPIKIKDGTEAPVRLIGLVLKDI